MAAVLCDCLAASLVPLLLTCVAGVVFVTAPDVPDLNKHAAADDSLLLVTVVLTCSACFVLLTAWQVIAPATRTRARRPPIASILPTRASRSSLRSCRPPS